MLLETTMAHQLQNEHYIFVQYLFSQPVIFSSDPFCYSLLRIFQTVSLKVYDKIVKKQLTFDLLCTSECCVTVCIFFPKFTDTKLVYKLVETLFTSCSILSRCFSFSFFFFCLPDMCAYAINFPTRSQTKISPTKAVTYPRHFFVDREVKKLSILETTLPTKVDILKVY